jgi:hypothetical protein
MAKIVLHMGPHKTATSYIQAAFHHNRALLQRHGLHYVSLGDSRAAHAMAGLWLDMPDLPASFYEGQSPEALWQALVARHADRPGTVFLSSETFSRRVPQPVDFADLARRLAPFEEVRILYTLRPQVDLVPSIWAQVTKMRFMPSVWTYMRQAWETGQAKGVAIDHGAVYDELRQGFAPEQIRLLDYAGFRRHPAGAFGVFLDLLGLGDLPAGGLRQPSREEANVSPDPLALFVAGSVIGDNSRPPDPDLVARLSTALDRIVGKPRTLLARHEYSRIRDRFAESNRQLVDRVQPYQPGFAFTEEEPPEGLVYRDDLDAQAWMQIASAVYHMGREDEPRRGWLGGW